MTAQSALVQQNTAPPDVKAWVKLGLLAAAVSVAAALLVQALALALVPDLALFKPLDSYARTALFVLVPTLGATALFAWLVKRVAKPVSKFIALSAIVLVVSFIPDFLLPDANKTLLASATAAFLHVVAGVFIVSILVLGYQRQQKRTGA